MHAACGAKALLLVLLLFAATVITPTTAQEVREYTFRLSIVTHNLTDHHGDPRWNPYIVANAQDTPGARTQLTAPVLHVRRGDTLAVTIINDLKEGVTVHWHGLSMHGYNVLDGVRDVTQCQIVRGQSFTYRFQVNEVPGTYHYHTESRLLSGGQDFIKGPLIVHPRALPDAVMAEIDAAPMYQAYQYGSERIMFTNEYSEYSDIIFLEPLRFEAPIPRARNGMGVSHEWWGGKINGRDRPVLLAAAGETLTLRHINGCPLFPYRLSIDTFKLTIVAADGSPVVPFETDAVDVYAGERFDVQFTVPEDAARGMSYWIRMRGLEDERLGYNYTMNAILFVGDALDVAALGGEQHVPDPRTKRIPTLDTTVVNCYVREKSPTCLPLTVLRPTPETTADYAGPFLAAPVPVAMAADEVEFHTVDFQVFPFRPYIGHFISLDGGDFIQFGNPYRPPVMPDAVAERDHHPHQNTMQLGVNKTVIMFLRSTTKFMHPMHLHGHRFEVLDVYFPTRESACNAIMCEWASVYESASKRAELAALPHGTGPFKDTVTLPGGGAVAIRFTTDNPGLWLASCNIKVHKEEGMSWLMQVGDNIRASPGSLPVDFPNCEDPDRVDKTAEEPACKCFDNKDHLFELRMTERYKCSRTALCYQADANRTARAEFRKYTPGIRMHTAHSIPGYAIALIVAALVVTIFVGATLLRDSETCRARRARHADEAAVATKSSTDDDAVPSLWAQIMTSYWRELPFASKSAINKYRILEVVGLALISGFIFFEIGKQTDARSMVESVSLLFYSLTLWTFTRMYVAIVSYHWYRYRLFAAHGVGGRAEKLSAGAAILGRVLVDLTVEIWWPFVFVLISFPTAQIVGVTGIWFLHGLFLALNNMCYIALGALLGAYSPSIPMAISGATLFSQMSIVCAGFYATLPAGLAWIRFISPVWYSYTGMARSHYKWSDTYDCPYGDLDAGVNQCWIETHPVFNGMKFRGINVATAYRADSDDVGVNVIILILLFGGMYLGVYLTVRVQLWLAAKSSSDDVAAKSATDNAEIVKLVPPKE